MRLALAVGVAGLMPLPLLLAAMATLLLCMGLMRGAVVVHAKDSWSSKTADRTQGNRVNGQLFYNAQDNLQLEDNG